MYCPSPVPDCIGSFKLALTVMTAEILGDIESALVR